MIPLLQTTQLYVAVIELAKCDLNSYIMEYRKGKPFSERVGAAVIRCIANGRMERIVVATCLAV